MVVAGSQKALMCPPGLAFVSASPAALERAAAAPGGRYYFDWERQLAEQRKSAPATPFTPAVSLVRALDVALGMIEDARAGGRAGAPPPARRARPARARPASAWSCSAIPTSAPPSSPRSSCPTRSTAAPCPRLLRDRCGITANGGQGQLKGRILRIAHCGYFGAFDVLVALAGLELVLRELGADVEPGSGVSAAQAVFAERRRRGSPAGRRVSDRPRILVAEEIAPAGVELLREHFEVEVDTGLSAEQLGERIGAYDGILIRSATQLTAQVIERADRLQVIARAGIGVDNVDVEAATKRGIVVANAPESNIVAAAEHTMALMLALARHVPQAHESLTDGRWERSRFAGTELYEKTLGILGFGRIGQLVAQRAKAFGMRVLAFDAYVAAERFRELGVERATSSGDVYSRADFITVHLPRTPETRGWLDADAFAQMREGVYVINCARGELLVDDALKDALDSGRVGGAALDVFAREPITDHPLFDGLRQRGRDPAPRRLDLRGAGPCRDPGRRAGGRGADRRRGHERGQHPDDPGRGDGGAGAVPAAVRAARPARDGARRVLVGRPPRARAARPRRRARHAPAVAGRCCAASLRGRTEEEVNLVNAPTIAAERGIEVVETKRTTARDFTDLVRVTAVCGDDRVRVVGTNLGRRHRPHLLEAWGQRFNVQLEPYVTLFRYSDVPGMLGRVGTAFGERGINIVSAAVGRQPDGDGAADGALAAMVVTTDARVGDDVIEQIVSSGGFVAVRTVALGE